MSAQHGVWGGDHHEQGANGHANGYANGYATAAPVTRPLADGSMLTQLAHLAYPADPAEAVPDPGRDAPAWPSATMDGEEAWGASTPRAFAEAWDEPDAAADGEAGTKVGMLRALLFGHRSDDQAARLAELEGRLDALARRVDAARTPAAPDTAEAGASAAEERLAGIERRLTALAARVEDTQAAAPGLDAVRRQVDELRREQVHAAAGTVEQLRQLDERCRLRAQRGRLARRAELLQLRRRVYARGTSLGGRPWGDAGARAAAPEAPVAPSASAEDAPRWTAAISSAGSIPSVSAAVAAAATIRDSIAAPRPRDAMPVAPAGMPARPDIDLPAASHPAASPPAAARPPEDEGLSAGTAWHAVRLSTLSLVQALGVLLAMLLRGLGALIVTPVHLIGRGIYLLLAYFGVAPRRLTRRYGAATPERERRDE